MLAAAKVIAQEDAVLHVQEVVLLIVVDAGELVLALALALVVAVVEGITNEFV